MTVQEKESALLSKIPFASTNSFSQSFLDYIGGKESLTPFYKELPEIENFKGQLENRNFPSGHRTVVAEVLEKQYEGFDLSESTKRNIDLIRDQKTFTITTGHQLNIFTGPLYFIYKIVTVIRACESLKEKYPQYNFVPVYWMASEDHDFDEISHFRFNGKKFSWNTDQTGAVGRFNTKELKSIFEEIISIPGFFQEAYLKRKTLAEAGRHYVNALFGDKGLVVIDADDHNLKTLLKPVITDDIFKGSPKKLVEATSQQLENLGYKTQVFPREINFFYLKDNVRSRIVSSEGMYEVLDTDIRFSESALQAEIEEFPERFSPNVVLRPLYQELLLPNLAYVGGPSELVYWLQLKDVFQHFETTFPLLMPRNFAGVVTPNILSKIKKEGLSFEEIFSDENELIKTKVSENSSHELALGSELERLDSVFNEVMTQAMGIDPTLEKLVAAERKKTENCIHKIEKKLLKAEKRNQETLVNRIYSIKEALFPGGSPQERKDNFLNFYIPDPNFIDSCMECFDAFDYRFHLITAYE
ncbi:MAG: bacillithiol biosynthesis cysteine-adding enzyme BshC [Roseivirga sp.]|nr:bacillithiol biosynthesis cysteine-adding enzyme BshC [Roseivirga sp.]